jgi:hypothetical protein
MLCIGTIRFTTLFTIPLAAETQHYGYYYEKRLGYLNLKNHSSSALTTLLEGNTVSFARRITSLCLARSMRRRFFSDNLV